MRVEYVLPKHIKKQTKKKQFCSIVHFSHIFKLIPSMVPKGPSVATIRTGPWTGIWKLLAMVGSTIATAWQQQPFVCVCQLRLCTKMAAVSMAKGCMQRAPSV